MLARKLIDPGIVIATLALGTYLVVTSHHPTQTEFDARPNNVLSAFEPLDIAELRWEGRDGFRLVRDPEAADATRYSLGQPGGRTVNDDVVREILSALDLAVWKRKLGELPDTPAEEFGFDKPRLELRIEAGPRSYRLLFGADVPGNSDSVYLLVEGINTERSGGLVPLELLQKLNKRKQEFLGGLVFPLLRSETSALTFTSLAPDTETVRRLIAQEHGFVLPRASGHTLADRTLSDLIFYQLARAKISAYEDEKAKYNHLLEVTQDGTDGSRYRALLGAPCPSDPHLSVIAQRIEPDPLVGCVPGSILAALQLSEDRLIARTTTVMNADEIDHVIVERGNKTVDIIRDGADYKLLSRRSDVVPRDSGDELFRALSSAPLILLDSVPPRTNAIGKLKLKGNLRAVGVPGSSDGPYQTSLDIHRGIDDRLLVKRGADGAWLEVPSEHSWLFSAEDGWARSPNISNWDEKDISRVEVTLRQGTSYAIVRSGDGFLLNSATDGLADPGLSRQLFIELASLRAVRFLAESRERPQDGLLKVEFELQLGVSRRAITLWIGGRIRGGYLAWCTEVDGTFVLPPEVRTTLETPVVDRRAFHINPDMQAVIELTTDGRKFRFERDAQVLRARGGEATDDMIDPLVAALSNLSVVSAAGNHPDAQTVIRGAPIVSIRSQIAPSDGRAPETVTLHFGNPTIWQGVSTHVAWIEGKAENYFVNRQTLSELLQLL